MGRDKHFGVELLYTLGFEKFETRVYLFIETVLQERTNFFHNSEWQVVLNIHISCVELVSKVFCSMVELGAHDASLIDCFKQT